MSTFGRITDNSDLLKRLARSEWTVRYGQLVDATNRTDAKGKPVLKWPKGLFDKVIELESGFDPATAPDAKLDQYALLVQPVYPDLKPLSVLEAEVQRKLAARYARPEFKPKVRPVSGFNPGHFSGPFFHGTRAFDKILVDGICSPPISQMVDPPIGAFAWWTTGSYWLEKVFYWYSGLSSADKLMVSKYLGSDTAFLTKTKQQQDETADALGALTLFFITERESTAKSYGEQSGSVQHAVLTIDPRYAEALDIIEDDLQGESSYAIIIPPGVCPQIDWRGISYKGDRLGFWK